MEEALRNGVSHSSLNRPVGQHCPMVKSCLGPTEHLLKLVCGQMKHSCFSTVNWKNSMWLSNKVLQGHSKSKPDRGQFVQQLFALALSYQEVVTKSTVWSSTGLFHALAPKTHARCSNSSQLAHTCRVTGNHRPESVYQIQVCTVICKPITFTHPLLVWRYHPQLKMTNQFEKPIASPTHKQNLVAPG